MCGNGHYSMRGIVEVVTQAEYDVWLAKQKPQYYTAFPEKEPGVVKSDSTVKAAIAKAP
jgi:cytochrome c oxidase subunit II